MPRILLALALALLSPASLVHADLLQEASLRGGDYGAGVAIDTRPDATVCSSEGGSPGVLGIVDSADGASFTGTEADGRSNALINWALGTDATSFRSAGTVTFLLRADRALHVNGSIMGDNYGFDQFNNGQGAFEIRANRVANGAGDEDDQVTFSWQTLHSGEWLFHHTGGVEPVEYEEWISLGFAWGGPDHDFEICADGEVIATSDLPGGKSLPWGLDSPPSATNFGLGDNHTRCFDAYGSAAGVTFADIEIWNEHRPSCGTTAPWRADHFTFYRAKTTRGEPRPAKFGPLTLGDAFRDADHDVVKPQALGVPADKNAEGIGDDAIHLTEYKVKPSQGSERFAKRKGVHITNQCNDLLLEVRKPVSLMVPAAVDLAQPASPPDPNSHDVDHFLCYAAKAQKKALDGSKLPKFPKGLQVEVVDAFQSRRYDLKRVTKYCQPTDKSGSPSLLSGPDKGAPKPIAPALQKHAEARLVCYQAKASRKLIAQNGCGPAQPGDGGTPISPKQAKHEKRSGIHVADQLGSGQRGTVKEVELCIPSELVSPDP